jgi:LysM repeat protein
VNKEEPYRDQAERLRQKIEKIKDGTETVNSGLPSRIDVHKDKKNKTKIKVKFPIIRLLALFFILLPIVIFSAYSTLNGKKINNSESVSGDNGSGYEEINLENDQEKDVQETNPPEEIEANNEENTEGNTVDSPDGATENSEEMTNEVKENDVVQETNNEVTNGITDQSTPPSADKDQGESDEGMESSPTIVYHTVQSNETLFRIAMNYYQSQAGIEIIQKANKLVGNEIKVGQVLKIPK